MTLYPQATANLAFWPEPIEIGYQLLGGGGGSTLAPKLDHLGLTDLLFMSSIMLVPGDRRPWGIVTWLADVFGVSRPTLYSLPKRVLERLTAGQPTVQPAQPAPAVRQVAVNATRLAAHRLDSSLSRQDRVAPATGGAD